MDHEENLDESFKKNSKNKKNLQKNSNIMVMVDKIIYIIQKENKRKKKMLWSMDAISKLVLNSKQLI
jgi:hypothetical protein